MPLLTEAEPCAKQCYRCDKPVRMSLPEFTRDANTWTTCRICRDTLTIEAKEIGPIAAARAKEAKLDSENNQSTNVPLAGPQLY